MGEKERSIRGEVADYLREQMERQRSVKLPALADKAARHFRSDPTFLKRFADAMLRQMIYDLGVELIGAQRTPVDLRTVMAKAQDVASGIWDRWEQQLEHVGDRYIRLPDLTPELGTVAIAERRQRAASEERVATLIERLIAPLNPGQRIREYWKPEQITVLQQELQPVDAAA